MGSNECQWGLLRWKVQKRPVQEFLLWHSGIGTILGALGLRFDSPTQHSGLRIRRCCSCGSDLIPDLAQWVKDPALA